MEQGTFAGWLKNDGDQVAVGDPLFTLESDKGTQEVEALDRGVLRIPPDGPQPGDVMAVGALLGYLVQPGEPVPFDTPATASPPESHPPEKVSVDSIPLSTDQPRKADAPGIPSPHRKPTISPRAFRLACELGVDWTRLTGSGRTGRIIERDVRAAAAAPPVGQAGTLVLRTDTDQEGVSAPQDGS